MGNAGQLSDKKSLGMEASVLTYMPIRNQLLHETLPYVAQYNLQGSKKKLDWAPIQEELKLALDSYVCLD